MSGVYPETRVSPFLPVIWIDVTLGLWNTVRMTPLPPYPETATSQLQAWIDAAAARGGGQVRVPTGTYRIGTLVLRDHIDLYLEAGAVLKASPNPADFTHVEIAGLYGGTQGGFLITATDAEHVRISGPGTLDGSALDYMDGWWHEPYIRAPKPWRPRGIGLFGCRHVKLESFTFRDSASWTIHLTGCEDVLCQGLHILNRLDVPNCDGIDPDHCRDVRIHGCHIRAADDGIVLKNTREYVELGSCERIVISGCTITSTSAGIKLGTESASNFRDVLVDNCIIHASHRGLAIQLRDQGTIENVSFTNCVVETRLFHERYWGRAEPIYVTSVARHDGDPAGNIQDVRFRNIRCRSENGIFLHGSRETPLRQISLEDVRVELVNTSKWPGGQLDLRPRHGREHGGLKDAVVHGIRAHHVEGLRLDRVHTGWTGERPDWAAADDSHCFVDCDLHS